MDVDDAKVLIGHERCKYVGGLNNMTYCATHGYTVGAYALAAGVQRRICRHCIKKFCKTGFAVLDENGTDDETGEFGICETSGLPWGP